MINIVIILVLIAVYIFFTKDNTKIIEGLNTFNGRMAIDDQYFYDKLFDKLDAIINGLIIVHNATKTCNALINLSSYDFGYLTSKSTALPIV